MIDRGDPHASRPRLAIVLSHPIQYFSPWFAHLAASGAVDVRVFYLWDFGVEARHDRDFGQAVQWDVPLLEGYESEFVPNVSRDPGTHRFGGLENPTLVDRLVTWRPDAILLFGYTYRTHVGVLFSRKLRRVPILMRGDSHDLARLPGIGAAVKKAIRRVLFRRVHAFLAVGEANTNYLLASGVPRERIFRAPHCVDNARFRAAPEETRARAAAWRRELAIPEAATVVLFAGKLEPKKRPLDLLAAFQEAVPESDGRAVLLFVGSGVLESALKQQAGTRLGRDVFFAGFQNQTTMPAVYASGDVLVLPSLAEETWGLCVNEAMNLGLPAIVSSYVGCAQDLVVSGETGWVFPAGDVRALSEILRRSLADVDRLHRMGEAARSRVSDYSFEAATAGLLLALDSVLAKRGAR